MIDLILGENLILDTVYTSGSLKVLDCYTVLDVISGLM